MKSYQWTLSLLIGGLLITPAALAQVGMDQQFNNNLSKQAQVQQQAAQQSTGFADTGSQAYSTAPNAWQDMSYIEGQQMGIHLPGSLQAPLQASPFGTASTYLGNTGQFLKGQSAALGKALPQTQLGLNAINGGYFGLAAPADYSGGFSGGMPSFTSPYPILPPTSTSIDVELNTVE